MHTNNPRPAFSWLSAVAVAAVLSACGGGGSSANRYTIAGEVQGLGSDTSVVLSLNGSESLTLASSSTFEFKNKLEAGQTYSVVVSQQPQRQTCTVSNGSGTVNSSVVNIRVQCDYNPDVTSTSQACLDNPQLIKPGNRWAITSASGVAQTTVTGAVNFHSNTAIERITQRGDGSTLKTYTNQADGQTLSLGSISISTGQPEREYFYTPALSHPLAMQSNSKQTMQSRQESWVAGNAGNARSVDYTVTYAGREAIQTAFGTFETCRMQYTTVATDNIASPWSETRTEWLITSGKYAGLPVQTQTGASPELATKIEASWN